MKIKLIFVPILGICTFLAFQGCAPVFSEMQTAKTVGKKNVEITPCGTMVFVGGELIQREVGAQLAYGISDKVDLRLRYVYVDGERIHAFGAAPKIALKKDKIALNLLMGTSYDSQSKTLGDFNFHPSLLFTTTPKENKIDLTFAPKLLVTINDRSSVFPAINFNASLSSNLRKWSIRPEVGLLFDGEVIVQTSLSFSFIFGKTEKK